MPSSSVVSTLRRVRLHLPQRHLLHQKMWEGRAVNNNNTHAIHHAVFPCCSVHPNSRCSIIPDITATWNRTLQDAVYHMRVYDALAIICELYLPFVNVSGVSFNTTHYITIGHSLGGAAAAGVLAVEDSTLDGVSRRLVHGSVRC
jgi:hypothetical protein